MSQNIFFEEYYVFFNRETVSVKYLKKIRFHFKKRNLTSKAEQEIKYKSFIQLSFAYTRQKMRQKDWSQTLGY